MEKEIESLLAVNEVVFVIALAESGRSYDLRQLGGQKGWMVIDLPAEEEVDIEGYEGVVVINSLDSVNNDRRMTTWRKVLTYRHQNPGRLKLIIGQGVEEVMGLKELLGGMYNYYQENRVWYRLWDEKKTGEFVGGQVENIYGLSGGYLPIIRRIKETGRMEMDGVIEASFEVLWECLADGSQSQLMELVRGGKNINFSEYLVKTGLVTADGQLFSPWWAEWLKRKLGSLNWNIIEKEGVLWLNGNSRLDNALSFQEYEVLKLLWQERGKEVSREKVADVLWHKDTEDKYSDWAIDQIISKLRKKVGDVGKERRIRTIKGVGFKLSQE